MRTNSELTGHNAKSDGFRDELDTVHKHLELMYQVAEQAFWLQRETDPHYQDPRTDYLLGRKEAILHVIKTSRKDN
jgi:hypothetical protein